MIGLSSIGPFIVGVTYDLTHRYDLTLSGYTLLSSVWFLGTLALKHPGSPKKRVASPAISLNSIALHW